MALYKILFLLTFIILSQVLYHVSAVNILAIVSLNIKSHYMAFQTLFRELAIRGHTVTVINNFPEPNPSVNLKFINFNRTSANMLPITNFEKFSSSFWHLYNFYNHFMGIGPSNVRKDCELFFTNKDINALREKRDQFDVIFVEEFMSDCALVFAAVTYDAPIIGITSHTLLPWSYPRLGIPFNVGTNSFYFSPAGKNPSVFQKVESYIMNVYANSVGRWQIQENILETFNKYLPNEVLDVEKIARERIKMMFVYQHHSITGARLITPQILDIAGIHIGKNKPVEGELEKFLSSATLGVVYVSFGSLLRANTMSKNKIEQFLLAFKKIPQKVLWKVDNVTLPIDDDKILISNWFPQLDILCHPKTVAFVSHGGMLSISEAAHCGKPLLTIPFFGDQFSNAAAVAESGLGSTMQFDHINDESLIQAIKHLTSPEMQENAQRVSKLWHDRPINVLDSAIYWTEYVARHKTAPPSVVLSTHDSWFQSSLIDVYSILLGIIMLILFVVYLFLKIIILVLKLFIGLCKSENKQKINNKHE
ncbi:UDP-glycosyltransferase UGT5-like [Melitaea cinxia]|uniref:UDP-glycosyltransferase UGT5-like n=1 Tax=Melitaea cinxia TaxID=113334 RepID=UPI001E272A5B|nr:UDP-glycosyltransferase UGT5-like [Melitaea cinxia]